MDEKSISKSKGGEATNISDCTICLQQALLPVKLPCGHIFCYLCAKGIILQSNKCALCRQAIPNGYLNNPLFVQQVTRTSDSSYKWFYKGQSGWWQYDERTNSEIETAYQNQQPQCEVMIAGNLYTINLTQNMQMQKHNPTSCRRIKRDLETVYKIGVAGVYIDSVSDSDSCKSSCSKNVNCSKSTTSEKLNGKTECIIILPCNDISGVNLNVENNGFSLCTKSKAASSHDNCQQLSNPVNLVDDDSSFPRSEDRKRKRVDISEFTEDDINKSYMTTILSKLQKMSKKQRLFSEKLINDVLFKGILGKLSENSCLSESI